MDKEYTLQLVHWQENGEYSFLDETSVDAETEDEAIEHATDLFQNEFGWNIVRGMSVIVVNERELTEKEIGEIESGVQWNQQ